MIVKRLFRGNCPSHVRTPDPIVALVKEFVHSTGLSMVVFLLVSVNLCLPTFSGPFDYWRNVIEVPTHDRVIPESAGAPVWDQGTWNVAVIVQLQNGVGRRQLQEIQKLKQTMGEQIDLAIYSVDQTREGWPAQEIRLLRNRLDISLPIYAYPPDQLKDMIPDLSPSQMAVFPQIIIFDQNRMPSRVLRGLHSAEQIQEAIESFTIIPEIELPPGDDIPSFHNGHFENWPVIRFYPQKWAIWEPNPRTMGRAVLRGWNRSVGMEIKTSPNFRKQLVFQIIHPATDVVNREITLFAMARGNCFARPRVVLGAIWPYWGKYDYVPVSPFKDESGNDIPIRILAACEFASGTSAWQGITSYGYVPPDVRTVLVLCYLDNDEDDSAAAVFDSIRVKFTPTDDAPD